MRLEFLPVGINGRTGLDLLITDRGATVGELLQAIQPWCADGSIYKEFLAESRGDCAGCPTNCCNDCQVVPDLISFHKLYRQLGASPQEFFAQYLDQDLLKRGLPRLRSSPCVFLQNRLCSVYRQRTLLCRLYICTPLSDRASTLIYQVVGAGMGAFLRYSWEKGLLGQEPEAPRTDFEKIVLHSLQQEAVNHANPFWGAEDYDQVPLEPFLDQYHYYR